MSRLRLYFVGAPRIELDGETVSLSHHKALALLAYLAVTGQAHTRLALAALLWPDHDPADARAEVRRMVWVLNKSLGAGWLEADRQTVGLAPRPDLWIDVDCFRKRLATSLAPNKQRPGPACPEALLEAAAMIRGDFMAGFTLADSPEFDTWQSFEAESLRRESSVALEWLVDALLQSGADPSGEQAISYARRWVALDPLHEPAHRQLMQLYCRTGQTGAALQQYQNCVRLLEEELGVPPSRETIALVEAIKANRQLLPDEPLPKAMDAPGPTSLAPHNLPVQATPFIGRETALDSLQQRLDAPEVRLITFVGPGGIGKTRLALALAERQLHPRSPFVDGVYFISLAPINSAATLAQTIAEGLAFSLSPVEEPVTQLLAYLQQKQLLLVLDNFEHLLEGAPLVSQILQTAAGVKLVITSRERLNLVNETLWPISGLNFAELDSVEEALTFDAVRLFVQRARQVRPDFNLRSGDLSHLKQTLQAVWGMPLAIELAAAWLNLLSVAEIAAELDHSLDLLESDLRDMPDRHRSMRLVFDRSWERLTADEQSLFKSLSIFRGGFKREAAEQIAGATLRLLAGLVNKSLLTSQPDSGRYELHELLRQYAAAHLLADSSVEQITRDRHSHYYLTLLQSRKPALTSRRQIETIAELSLEIDNLRTAWAWAVARQQIDLLRQAAWPLWYFYELRNYSQEGDAVLRQAAEMVQTRLAAPHSNAPEQEQAGLAGLLGELQAHRAFFNLRQGNQTQTAALFESSVRLLRPLNEPALLAHALAHFGAFQWNTGQLEEAARHLQESLEISRPLNQPWELAIFTAFLGGVVHEQGDYEEAYRLLSEALIHARALGDPRLISFISSFLSRTALVLDRFAEVQSLLGEGLRLARETGDRFSIGLMLERLAVAAHSSGQNEEADRLFAESIALYRDINDPWSLSRVLILRGHFVLAEGDCAGAQKCFKQAEQLALAAHIDPNRLDALAGLAVVADRTGQVETALALVIHILRHPAGTRETKDRAEKLRPLLEAKLTPRQVEAIRAEVQAHGLEALMIK